MGKKKSVVLMTLLTIVMVVLCAVVALPTFAIPGSVQDWNPAALQYDFGKDFGGSYYAYYYPEGVISEAEFKNNLKMLPEEEQADYIASYHNPEGTNLYLDADEDKNIIIKGEVDADFEANVAKAADLMAKRIASFGYSNFRVSVVDKYAVKVELPKDAYAPQALSFMTWVGELTLQSGGSEISEMQKEGAKVSDFVRGFSVFTRYKVAFLRVDFTEAGKKMISGLKSTLSVSTESTGSSSATTLDFKIGENTLGSIYRDYVDDYNNYAEIPVRDEGDKAFVNMVQVLLTTAMNDGGADVAFRSLLASDLRQAAPVYGENVKTVLFIALAVIMVAACVASVCKLGGFGVVNVYMTASYLIIVGLCFGFITSGVFEISFASLAVFLAGLILVNVLGARTYHAIKAEFDAGKTVESAVKTGYNKSTGGMVDIYAVLLLASLAMLIGVAGVYTMALQAIICVITAAFCNLLWGRVINHMLLSASANKYKYFRFVREDDDDE